MPGLVLAIDLGTSGPKIGIVSHDGRVLDSESGETKLILGAKGLAEQDPADWWAAITRTSRILLSRNSSLCSSIQAIGVTAQWSGTVPIGKNGDLLQNCIIWMDTRGAKYIPHVVKGLVRFEGYGLYRLLEWIRLSGGVPTNSGKDPIAHILFLKNEKPEIYQNTYKFLEPKDYLNFLLTGKIVASFDSISLHWVTDTRNPQKISYNSKLLRWSGIDPDKLPELMNSTDILGNCLEEKAKELGLRSPVPVVCGSPDIQSAAVGSGAVKDFEGHLYVGTSSWIVTHVPFKKTDIFHNMTSLPSPIPGRYFLVNEQETTGECLRFLANRIFFPEDILQSSKPDNLYEKFSEMAERVPTGANGLYFFPWLVGERTPIEDHNLRGGFYNMSLHHTRQDMIRAVMEGVALNLKWLFKYAEKFAGRKFEYLNLIGGGARSEVWCQIFSDVLGIPMRKVKDPIEANIRGAGIIASVGMGWTNFEKISNSVEIEKTFNPISDNSDFYNIQFNDFIQIYKANKKIFKRINQR